MKPCPADNPWPRKSELKVQPQLAQALETEGIRSAAPMTLAVPILRSAERGCELHKSDSLVARVFVFIRRFLKGILNTY